MNKLTIFIFVLSLILAACAPAANTVNTKTPLPATSTAFTQPSETLAPEQTTTPPLTPTPTVEATPEMVANISTADFTVPEPEVWVMLMKPVREYFYYRKEAVVKDDVQILWYRYPGLKQGNDFSTGVNAEVFLVDMYRQLKPFDGNIFPEYYDKIKVIMGNGKAEVLVHGLELFLYKDEAGQYDDSGGEFKIVLFLSSQGNQNWTVDKTIDITGP